MPLFDYQCLQCAHIIEDVLQKSDDDLKYCPECGTEGMRKLLGVANFHLKGDGWYKPSPTDDKSE